MSHLHDRDCSLQRRHQKIVEVAPAPRLGENTREVLGELGLENDEIDGLLERGAAVQA